jgi:hypothetical protein
MRPNAYAKLALGAPGPLTLLLAARSPGRPHCCGPPVGSYPTVSALTVMFQDLTGLTRHGGYAFCCGCSHTAVSGRTPPLTVSWGSFSTAPCGPRTGVGKFLPRLRPSGSNPTGRAQPGRNPGEELPDSCPAPFGTAKWRGGKAAPRNSKWGRAAGDGRTTTTATESKPAKLKLRRQSRLQP